jgi:hypothetical protein
LGEGKTRLPPHRRILLDNDQLSHRELTLAYVYAKTRQRAEAERICRELQQRAEKEGVGAYEVAFIDAALGKKEEAFHWLDIAYQQHDTGLKYLKGDPCLDPLRSDPRFHELLCRVGLTPYKAMHPIN